MAGQLCLCILFSLSLSPEVEGKKRERSVDWAKELGHTSKSWTMLEEKN
jgi:hypothetical protein